MADRLKSYRIARRFSGSLLLATALSTSSQALAAETEFSTEPSWQLANPDAVYRQLESYVHTLPLAPDRASKIRDLWWQADAATNQPADLLDRLANCLAEVDDRVSQLVAFCAQAERPTTLPDFSWLANSETPPLVRFNMRLYYARWLAQNGYDDEAIAWTDGLTPADVVAPDTLLFYRAVASHRIVNADRADATVAELLQRSDDLPIPLPEARGVDAARPGRAGRRFARSRGTADGRRPTPARIGPRGEDRPSRRRRRRRVARQDDQGPGRPGPKAAIAGRAPPAVRRAAPRCRTAGWPNSKRPGKVDQRDIGHGADWGDMPDKEREQALQDVGREFPSHYREVIEEYFRRLAAEESDDAP